MSSILEALRELESRRVRPASDVVAPAEQPAASNRAIEVIGIACIGLLIGALGFLLFLGLSGLLRKTGREAPAPAAAPARRRDAPAPARPAWLETADPPRARIGRQASARSSDELPGRDDPAPPPASAGRIEVDAIEYSPDVARRSVTLRLEGGAVLRLRERESARGVEVQSIQPNGVYVRRGGEIVMLAPSR